MDPGLPGTSPVRSSTLAPEILPNAGYGTRADRRCPGLAPVPHLAAGVQGPPGQSGRKEGKHNPNTA